jgi:hypothetical protein
MEETVKLSEMEARGSKTLIATEPMREPSWLVWMLMKGFRTVVLTVFWAGIGMGVGLFCGIMGVLLMSLVQHRAVDMSVAYRYVAIPVAIVSGTCTLGWNLCQVALEAAERRRTAKP